MQDKSIYVLSAMAALLTGAVPTMREFTPEKKNCRLDGAYDSTGNKKWRMGSADVHSKGNRCGWRKRSDQRKADRNKKIKERANRYWVPNPDVEYPASLRLRAEDCYSSKEAALAAIAAKQIRK